MKLMIDIPEEVYKNIQSKSIEIQVEGYTLENAVLNGIPIPDNDCNNCEKAWTNKCERAECYENNYKHWMPYQKGDNSEYLGGELYDGEFESR